MSRSSGVTRFFVDGSKTRNQTTLIPLSPTAFTIGSASGVRFFNGAIDDIRIYNRALSTSEVAYLYQIESQTQLTPPLFISASSAAGQSINLNLAGLPEHTYILQVVTNLTPPIIWQPVTTNTTDTNGFSQFTDTFLDNPEKYYRAVTPYGSPKIVR